MGSAAATLGIKDAKSRRYLTDDAKRGRPANRRRQSPWQKEGPSKTSVVAAAQPPHGGDEEARPEDGDPFALASASVATVAIAPTRSSKTDSQPTTPPSLSHSRQVEGWCETWEDGNYQSKYQRAGVHNCRSANAPTALGMSSTVESLSSAEASRVSRGVQRSLLSSIQGYDNDGEGRLSPTTLTRAIGAALPELPDDDVKELVQDADRDLHGRIEYARLLKAGLCVLTAVSVQMECKGASGFHKAGTTRWEWSCNEPTSTGPDAHEQQQDLLRIDVKERLPLCRGSDTSSAEKRAPNDSPTAFKRNSLARGYAVQVNQNGDVYLGRCQRV